MNKSSKAALAGGLGALLLIGGTTFALWSDSDQLTGGSITAGDLQVALASDDIEWSDVSADITEDPIAIDLDDFRIVPGDTIQGVFGVKGVLDGDNLTGDLTLTVNDTPAVGSLLEGLVVTYQVFEDDGTTAISSEVAAGATVTFRSVSNTATSAASLPTLPATLPDDPNLVVQVNVTFDDETEDRDLTTAAATLADLGVALVQTRPLP